ncbi:MAG: prepilin-type N-terminal cleavage/methylation domain-containing protein [Verrucomicrobiota bacterium]
MKKRRKSGFTFLEIMMVVGIALVLATLSVPMFVQSYRGQKLKTSARTISMVHRYARSVSVLQQKPAAVLYDTENGRIKVIVGTSHNTRMTSGTDLPSFSGDDDEENLEWEPLLTKQLESDVWFDDVRLEGNARGGSLSGIVFVRYHINGMCDKYKVRLRDKRDRYKEIDVDHISGTVRIRD